MRSIAAKSLSLAKSRGLAKSEGRIARRAGRACALAVSAMLAVAGLSGCSVLGENVIHRGYVFDDQTLGQVKIGAPAEQVLNILGTPTTTSTVGGDAWYYISQKVEQALPSLPPRITDQRVYAVYFDKNKRLARVANYGLEDGKVIDMTSRQTVAGGGESRLLQGMLKQLSGLQYHMF
jgi:outer membrane protein assembly factor BamE (lipoprotein component of BamABCDE complex)